MDDRREETNGVLRIKQDQELRRRWGRLKKEGRKEVGETRQPKAGTGCCRKLTKGAFT
jgi:hypothetical protein